MTNPLADELAGVLRMLCSDDAPCLCDDWMVTPEGQKCCYCLAKEALAKYDREQAPEQAEKLSHPHPSSSRSNRV